MPLLDPVPYRQVRVMTATDTSRYARGARDDAARAAATMATKRWRIRVEREGPQRVTPGPTRRQLRALHKRMTWLELETILPVNRWTFIRIDQGRAKHVSRTTAEAIEALWLDVCAPVEKDRRRWPIEPLKKAVESRYGTVKGLGNTNMARQIWKGTDITTKTAEKYAETIGLLPVEVWTDWYLQ